MLKCNICDQKVKKPFWMGDLEFCQSCFMTVTNMQASLNTSEKEAIDIQQTYLVVNGEPSVDTLAAYLSKGFMLVKKDKAKRFHPYAAETDIILFFARPINKEAYDNYKQETFREVYDAVN